MRLRRPKRIRFRRPRPGLLADILIGLLVTFAGCFAGYVAYHAIHAPERAGYEARP